MTPTTSTLSYRGTPIRLRGAMLNLTDMWRAAGCPEHRRPADWLAFEETARFRSPRAGPLDRARGAGLRR